MYKSEKLCHLYKNITNLTESDNVIVGGFFVANFFLTALTASLGLKVIDII